jgi:hypothetical protein
VVYVNARHASSRALGYSAALRGKKFGICRGGSCRATRHDPRTGNHALGLHYCALRGSVFRCDSVYPHPKLSMTTSDATVIPLTFKFLIGYLAVARSLDPDPSCLPSQEAEWIDSTSLAEKTEDVDKVVDDYRSLYSAAEVESSSKARMVYDAVEQLYVVGEAAKLVELYADHMTELVRHHMDLTGFLGSACNCPTCRLPLIFECPVGKNGASNISSCFYQRAVVRGM